MVICRTTVWVRAGTTVGQIDDRNATNRLKHNNYKYFWKLRVSRYTLKKMRVQKKKREKWND